MPKVQIDAQQMAPERLRALGDAVHQALIEAIGIPEDDFFQILTSHDGTTGMIRYDPGYLGVHRDDGLVYVAVTLRAGRTVEQKRHLYRRIAELAAERAHVEPRNVFVTLTENQLPDWSFGDGVAQYVPAEAEE
ncbi:tautomerase family protein [Mangrovactinospora gilvigrisea]|uniref:Tautomerase family protein n=1 Tax=Mangrovactinospora gilvigrisea TaxID=1428644 RepID=A0A1J7BS51_9ACTN|nr:tautomerase family protein [Mangrovactinospora gilvigrisea]OIV36289.1 tautomerase family protein [Mangrovactinospora gilvigrisea]